MSGVSGARKEAAGTSGLGMVSTWKLREDALGGNEMERGAGGRGQVAGIGPQGRQRSWRGAAWEVGRCQDIG